MEGWVRAAAAGRPWEWAVRRGAGPGQRPAADGAGFTRYRTSDKIHYVNLPPPKAGLAGYSRGRFT